MSSSAAGSAQVSLDTRKKTSGDGDLGSEDTPEKEDAADDEIEGQVCDICGDAGYDNLLAVCTQCGEGAEHVYCMQKTLEEKPKDWLCEACKKIQRENPSKQAEWQAAQLIVRNLSRSVSMTSNKKVTGPGNARSRIGARLEKKLSGRRAVKGVPAVQTLPMKRPVEDAAVGPSAKRTALEGSIRTFQAVGSEDIPTSSIQKSAGDAGSSPGPVSKAFDDSGSSGKVHLGGNAEVQLKRHVDDAAASPAAKRPALGINASVSGGFSSRAALQTGKAGESGKVRFISPLVPATPGQRGAKTSMLPESPVLPSPRTNYKPPSQRGSYSASSAVSSEGEKITNSKGAGNSKAVADGMSFLLPNKTDLQWKGDISASRNKDGSTKGVSQPQLTPRPTYISSSRGVTDVSSAIASAKLAKGFTGRLLSSGSELKERPDSSSRPWSAPDGLTPPSQKPSKALSKSLSDLSAQKNQVPKLGLAGKGVSQDALEEKQEAGASIAKKLQEKSLAVENHFGATGGSELASAQGSSHDDNLSGTSVKDLDDKQSVGTAATLHKSGTLETTSFSIDLNGSFDLNLQDDTVADRPEMGKLNNPDPALPVGPEADGCAGTSESAPSKSISLRDVREEELMAATGPQGVKVEASSEGSGALLKTFPTQELGRAEHPQGTKDGLGAVSCASPLTIPKPGPSSFFRDQGAVVDSSTGNCFSKVVRPIDCASQKLDLGAVPKHGETPLVPSKLTGSAIGEAEKKRDRLPMLDLNVVAPNTDSDSEEQQLPGTKRTKTPETEADFTVEPLTENLPATATRDLPTAVDFKHLAANLLKGMNEAPDVVKSNDKQLLSMPTSLDRTVEPMTVPSHVESPENPPVVGGRHVLGDGPRASSCLTKAIMESSREKGDSSREQSQKASIMRTQQGPFTWQDSMPSTYHLDPLPPGVAGLPLPNGGEGASAGGSSALTRGYLTERLVSEVSVRPSQKVQPVETGIQGPGVSTWQDSMPTSYHLNPRPPGVAGLPLHNGGEAPAGGSSAITREDVTGRLVLQKPSQQVQPVETGSQGPNASTWQDAMPTSHNLDPRPPGVTGLPLNNGGGEASGSSALTREELTGRLVSQMPRQQQVQPMETGIQGPTASTWQGSMPTSYHLDPLPPGVAGLPVHNGGGEAPTCVSSGLTIEEFAGRMASLRPSQQVQPVETGIQGPNAPAMPRGIVWRGCFNVFSTDKPMQYCGVMDAHISSKAVARVYEVANRLPQILRLEEARRGVDGDSWPRQFQRTPPDDESIALYFFASNVESYDKYYKQLLDRMRTHDLVLRGTVVEGAELLVISSHLLPVQYQHQNDRMFMWGVFRAKKTPGLPPASTQAAAATQGANAHLTGDGAIRSTSGSTHPMLDPVVPDIGRPALAHAPSSQYPPLPCEPHPDPPPPPSSR